MNPRRLSASIFAILGTALLFACGMPPIPPPQGETRTLPAGRTPFETQATIEMPTQDARDFEPDRTATAAAFAAAGTQAAEASQAAHQATRQAREVENAVPQTGTAAAGAKPPVELSEVGEGVGEPDFSGPGDESPQPEAGREPSTGVQRIYIRGGVYNLSSRMCGGLLYDLGSNVINPTWYITLRCP